MSTATLTKNRGMSGGRRGTLRNTVLLLAVVVFAFFCLWENEEATKLTPSTSLPRGLMTEGTTAEKEETTDSQDPQHSPRFFELLDEIVAQSPVCAKRGRPVNVLALGGSVTWGASVKNRKANAYPALISPNATNLAIRATGPEIPSVCLQSMLEHLGLDNVEYDLITLEYSLNGIACMQPLLKRLRRRYPKAIVMYVDVWSFAGTVVDKQTKRRPSWLYPHRETPADLAEDALEYAWPGQKRYNVTVHTRRFVKAAGGVFYRMPVPDNPKTALDEKWYGDTHHLGVRGHEIVAEGILRTYCETLDSREEEMAGSQSDEVVDPEYPYDGTWGLGDQCSIWYMGDEPREDRLQVEGSPFVEFDRTKFAYEVPTPQEDANNQGLTFKFQSQYDRPYKLGFIHMAKFDWYPRTTVTVKGSSSKQEQQSKFELNPRDGAYHISRLKVVGKVVPQQENIVTFQPMETTAEPLRITAILVCPECSQLHEGRLQCPMFESSKDAIVYHLPGESAPKEDPHNDAVTTTK